MTEAALGHEHQPRGAGGGTVVVTGMSGAGKTTALRALADAGYYCVDNLPPTLAPATVRVCHGSDITQIALGMDVRAGAFLESAPDALETLRHHPHGLRVLFLSATDDVLVRRFRETRRPHPAIADSDLVLRPLSLGDGVRLEREELATLRGFATTLLDTSQLSVHELRRLVLAEFDAGSGGDAATSRMQTRVMSFGFKYGAPLDVDLMFDVRFLDNPYFNKDLKMLSGLDDAVRDSVLGQPASQEFLQHLNGMLKFLHPRYAQEGKSYLSIGIGCTGGRHRSVTIANVVAKEVARWGGRVGVTHRDVARGKMQPGQKTSSWIEAESSSIEP